MADAWDVIVRGRGWFEDGEPPEAVIQEVQELLKESPLDPLAKAALLLVSAEASRNICLLNEASDAAAEAVAIFHQFGEKRCELEAMGVLVELHLNLRRLNDAAELADLAVERSKRFDDDGLRSAALLRLSRVKLVQGDDPQSASHVAIEASKVCAKICDRRGVGEAKAIAAQALLLSDPQSALKHARSALQDTDKVSDAAGRAQASKLFEAAKTQISTIQRAGQATAQSARGDKTAVKHEWAKIGQQRGERAYDQWAHGCGVPGNEEEDSFAVEGEKPKTADVQFMRKNFKWTDGSTSTDAAWYRQELRFLPPPGK